MIAERLKKARMEKGISQTELGKMSGVSHIQINRYEKGSTKPTAKVLKKLAIALDVETEYFYEGSEIEKTSIKEIDSLYNEARDLISDNETEMVTIKTLLEATIFNNRARRKFSS